VRRMDRVLGVKGGVDSRKKIIKERKQKVPIKTYDRRSDANSAERDESTNHGVWYVTWPR